MDACSVTYTAGRERRELSGLRRRWGLPGYVVGYLEKPEARFRGTGGFRHTRGACRSTPLDWGVVTARVVAIGCRYRACLPRGAPLTCLRGGLRCITWRDHTEYSVPRGTAPPHDF